MQPQSLQLISQSEIFLTFGSKRIDYGARKKHEGEDVMSEAWSARKTWELLHGPCSLRTPSTKTWSFISWLCDRYTDDGMVSSKVNKKLIRTIPKSTLSSTKDSITIDLWSVYAMGFSNGLRVHQALLVWLAQQPISLFAMLLVQTAHQVAHIFPPLEGPMNHCLTPSIAFLLFSAQHPSKTACLSSPPPHPSLSLSLSRQWTERKRAAIRSDSEPFLLLRWVGWGAKEESRHHPRWSVACAAITGWRRSSSGARSALSGVSTSRSSSPSHLSLVL